jgi:hypothetical protein
MTTATITSGDLAQRYQALRGHYDKAALRYKWWFRFIALTGWACTWLSLVLVVFAGLVFPNAATFGYIVLHLFTPLLSGVVFAFSMVLLLHDPRSWWTNARWATEQLRSAACLYRARVAPYHGEHPEKELAQQLHWIDRRARLHGEALLNLRRLGHWVLLARRLREDLPHTPDEPNALVRAITFAAEEKAVLQGRLGNQRQWLLRRARTFALRWLLWFQVPIFLVSALNFGYAVLVGRFLYIAGMAMSVTLAMLAARDLLAYGPLFARYVHTAGNLDDLRKAYLVARGELTPTELPDYLVGNNPFDGLDPDARLRLLAERTERILGTEVEYWYASAH